MYRSPVQDDRRVAVIGSGPAGATAAKVLSEAGIDVTLLEAGSERSSRGLTARVAGVTVMKLRQPPLKPRSEGISATADSSAEMYEELSPGGLTNYWSCAVPRFSKEDFEDAARAGEAFAWPIGYDDLVPWYERVEPLLHIAGTNVDAPQLPAGKVRRAWELARDWRPIAEEAQRDGRAVLPLPYAYGSDTTVTFSNNVFNAYVRLVKPALRSGKIQVRFGARVLRLERSSDGRVGRVVYRNRTTGAEEALPCRAVVVAAGAIGTAQILLESRDQDFPEGLGNTHGVLGRYLHDHPLAKLVLDLRAPITVHPPAYLTRPSIQKASPLYAAACVQWTGSVIRAKSVLTGRLDRLPWTGFNVFGTMAPSPDNRVELDSTGRLSDGVSAIKLHIRHPDEARTTLTETRNALVELLGRAKLAPRIRIWHTEPVGHSIHYAGTCRMHASPKFGMLDAFSRIHAVPNVVVADSAAFTTGPEKNPVLTAMALSARASDRLARDLRAGEA